MSRQHTSTTKHQRQNLVTQLGGNIALIPDKYGLARTAKNLSYDPAYITVAVLYEKLGKSVRAQILNAAISES